MKQERTQANWQQFEHLPVLGICGSSGSGKTTLIEALIPQLVAVGIRLAVIKHGANRVEIDKAGKDSYRFFHAGANVGLYGEEIFVRQHSGTDFFDFTKELCLHHDLVLVEGHGSSPVTQFWLQGPKGEKPGPGPGMVLDTLAWDTVDTGRMFERIWHWLGQQWLQTPVYGCVLIGGKSRRMGSAKHLLKKGPFTWLEQTVQVLEKKVDRVVISGQGELPESLQHLPRIQDAPLVKGPIAGLLSIMRWNPSVSWLVTACDLPDLEEGALDWLLSTRRPGNWATMPDLCQDGRVEPLLSYYDFRCRHALESLAGRGSLRISELATGEKVDTPQPPFNLHGSWRNVNTPGQLTEK